VNNSVYVTSFYPETVVEAEIYALENELQGRIGEFNS